MLGTDVMRGQLVPSPAMPQCRWSCNGLDLGIGRDLDLNLGPGLDLDLDIGLGRDLDHDVCLCPDIDLDVELDLGLLGVSCQIKCAIKLEDNYLKKLIQH